MQMILTTKRKYYKVVIQGISQLFFHRKYPG
jgi:hypothetical protein